MSGGARASRPPRSGGLSIRVTGGVGGGASNDVLNVTGSIALAGKLTLNFLDAFAPKQGETLNFLQAGVSLSGSFDQVVLAGLAPGFQYQLTQPATGVLSLTALNDGVATSAPRLSIARAGDQLLISWPDTATGYTLQTPTNLDSGVWEDVSTARRAISSS